MRVSNILICLLLCFLSCSKYEWTNPYDPISDKALFTPSGPGAVMEGNSVKVSWSQSNDKISGFALFRSVEGEPITSLAQVEKTTTAYVDATVTAGKRYTYYIVAVAGNNNSDTVKFGITPIFLVSVSTGSVSEITPTSAKVSAEITNAGGGSIISRGICWSTTPGPTISGAGTTAEYIDGTGAFVSNLSSLQPGTIYYARAYSSNSRGVSYGAEVIFSTLGGAKLTTAIVTSISSNGAVSGGDITDDGGTPNTSRGVCWSTSQNPTIANAKTVDGSGTGSFTSNITGLSASTTYYVRAYATNQYVTTYGQQVIFITNSIQTNENQFLPFIRFDGASSYVLVGQSDISTKINNAGVNFTIEGWVKLSLPTQYHQTIISSGYDGNGWNNYNIFLYNNRLNCTFRNGATLNIGTNFPTDSIWHHFAIIYENKKTTVIYIDGIEQIRANNTGMFVEPTPNLTIGTRIDPTLGPENFFNGGIRQLRISGNVRYTSNFQPQLDNTIDASTISFWDLNEGAGTTIAANISSYNGILYNGLWVK